MREDPSLRATIVCCIEAGRLEAETVMMVESLRAFGGSLATARVLAVVGRAGPALAPATVERLNAADVDIRRAAKSAVGYEWFGYSNKVRAIELAQAEATTDTVIWLDSDILIAGDLADLVLPPDVDVAVRGEPLIGSVSADDRANEPYWRRLATELGADYETIPWLEHDGKRQLAYFNSGVVAWRRGSGFAAAYVDAFTQVLKSRLAQRDGSFFAADQVILAPVIARLGLRWRHLPVPAHRIVFPALLTADNGSWANSALLHYSGSLRGAHRSVFEARLAKELPALAVWLASFKPPVDALSKPAKVLAAALKLRRHLAWRLFAAKTVNIDA